ncbi:putative protein phosphatase 2C 26 [Tetrabaena socialis]|uniref:Protein phosphatase n=1 Tax=Tetrabaena socialis TaxID=47790 RepID=A0A2J8A7V7_9CHLO|nr:putative protein phosphatase 2C 26 [Tetrabaena socialis]|eukprot:PNH08619.1 putative protein phosphatase 2C 26 [Tetrabaena socialis]
MGEMLLQRDAELERLRAALLEAEQRGSQAEVESLGQQERERQQQQHAAKREQQLQASRGKAARAQLQAALAGGTEAQRAEVKASQEAVNQQVRMMEASWRAQLEAGSRSLAEASAEKQRLAAQSTAAAVQVRQQLSELDTLRRELAGAQAAVGALRRAAESSRDSAAAQSAAAQREVQGLAAQVARLQDALQAAGGADPRELLAEAQAAVRAPGSCTACVATLLPRSPAPASSASESAGSLGLLCIANLGDSGVRVVRRGALVLASSPQEHQFNMPYQLAHPDNLPGTDTASDAQMYQLALEPGDVIIIASDGLYDNMWDEQLASLAAAAATPASASAAAPPAAAAQAAAQQLAATLANTAFRHAQDPSFRSPWAVELANQPEVGHAKVHQGRARHS